MLQGEVIGNIGKDAEIREFGERKYVSFTVAHSERKRNQDGQFEEHTVWVSVLWYGDGGKLFQYLKKGCKVFVRGDLSVRKYLDRNQVLQFTINVNANEVTVVNFAKEDATSTQQALKEMKPQEQSPYREDKGSDDLPF